MQRLCPIQQKIVDVNACVNCERDECDAPRIDHVVQTPITIGVRALISMVEASNAVRLPTGHVLITSKRKRATFLSQTPIPESHFHKALAGEDLAKYTFNISVE